MLLSRGKWKGTERRHRVERRLGIQRRLIKDRRLKGERRTRDVEVLEDSRIGYDRRFILRRHKYHVRRLKKRRGGLFSQLVEP